MKSRPSIHWPGAADNIVVAGRKPSRGNGAALGQFEGRTPTHCGYSAEQLLSKPAAWYPALFGRWRPFPSGGRRRGVPSGPLVARHPGR